jgi:hypothetical protein
MSGAHDLLAVIRVWAAIAWADGELKAIEGEALRRLIGRASLGEGDRAAALGLLDRRVDLDTAGLAGLDLAQRLGVYRAAVRLARIDRTVAPEEEALLGRLARGLGLEAAAVRAVDDAVRTGERSR